MDTKSHETNSKTSSISPSTSPTLPAAKESATPSKPSKKQHQRFCLKWNKYQANLTHVFDQLLQNELFVDVTLACGGRTMKAHKIVLSACSPYFQALFLDNPCQHPTIILRDIEWTDLRAAIEFMYKGEVNVFQEQIGPLLRVAEMLKIRGLTEIYGDMDMGDEVAVEPRPRDTIDDNVSIVMDNLADIMAVETKKFHVAKVDLECDGNSGKEPMVDTKGHHGRSWTPPPLNKRRKTQDNVVAEGEEESATDNMPTPSWDTGSDRTQQTEHRTTVPITNIRPVSEGPSLTSLAMDDMEIKPEIAEMIREEEKVNIIIICH